MKIIKKFSDLPEDWKEQMLANGKGISLTKTKPGKAPAVEYMYPRPPKNIYRDLGIPKQLHEKFLTENIEYREVWEFALELCEDSWTIEAARGMTDRNIHQAGAILQVNTWFPGTYDESKLTPSRLNNKVNESSIKKESKKDYINKEIQALLDGNTTSNSNAENKERKEEK